MSEAATSRPYTDVAVGILLRADGALLLTTRPAGKVYAGYWEFPGGKLEADAPPDDAPHGDPRYQA